MRVRHLRLRLATDCGPHGLDLPLANDGLTVLWADNSMGKSTCFRSILVGLGLEGMLTTNKKDLPLPPAMKSQLKTKDALASVIESEIWLEIQVV